MPPYLISLLEVKLIKLPIYESTAKLDREALSVAIPYESKLQSMDIRNNRERGRGRYSKELYPLSISPLPVYRISTPRFGLSISSPMNRREERRITINGDQESERMFSQKSSSMATPSHSMAVKSLNNSVGRRRFVFKTFSQRIEDIDIDVYRCLDIIKSEPSEGSSFFRDCLVEWRELNTAEDFISFYEEIVPFVQTLPLVLLHKDTIMLKLLSVLHIKARLSVEPILRLIAALSRDLLEEFLPFLPNIAESLYALLESGADTEPEIIEQIFTSWSYIMMYLQKYLINNLDLVLKVTRKLRFYPKDFVQDFMAEAISFLFRNAPFDQLKLGVWKVIHEVAKKPDIATRKYGVSALLCYVMKGTSSKLHSKAERVLRLLMSNPVLCAGDKYTEGSDIFGQGKKEKKVPNTVVEVLILSLQRLCEIIEPKELNIMWKCLHMEIADSVKNKSLTRLSHLLSLLVSTVQINDGRSVSNHQPMIDAVALLLQELILHTGITTEDSVPEIFDQVLELMLCTLDVLHNYDDMSIVSDCSLQWAPVFELKRASLLAFIHKLLLKDHSILNFFKVNILSALNDLIETSPKEVENNLDLLWGTVNCFPYLLDPEKDSSVLADFIDALDQCVVIESDNAAGVPKHVLQSIIGSAIHSYSKLHRGRNDKCEETSRFLHLARRHKSCTQILSAVADFLDSAYGSIIEENCNSRTYHPELKADKAVDAIRLFAENLHHAEKGHRVAALRLLCHYELLICDVSAEDQPAHKKLKTESSENSHTDSQSFNLLQLLLLIETTPLSVSTFRTVTLYISKVHMALSARRISEVYIPLLVNGMIGVFHNRFSYVWNPASECLAVALSNYVGLVWEGFLGYFKQILSTFQASNDHLDKAKAEFSSNASVLAERFKLFVAPPSDGTPLATVITLLLQSLQRIPTLVDSRSRDVVPLLLKFLGYDSSEHISVGSFSSLVCKGKDWKVILKEWLNLLKLMRNLKSFYRNQFLKDVLENRLLDANDPEIQAAVLECLLIWKDDFLLSYDQHLKNILSFNSFREELTTWSLSRESKHIEEYHRPYLVPIVIRLLMPKVRKLKKNASRKHASVNYRKAVLGFLEQLDVDELPLFYGLLMKPLQIGTVGSDDTSDWFWTSSGSSKDSLDAAKGYRSLDENQNSSNPSLLQKENTEGNTVSAISAVKQFKDLRSSCLKIVSLVLNKYEDHDFGYDFWDLFFKSVKPLVESFKQEGSSGEKPSSLFSCFVAMTRSQKLVPLLCREKSLVPDIFSILTVTSASEAIVRCVLKFIENLLYLDSELDGDDVKIVLLPNLDALICSLHVFFQSECATKRKLIKDPGEGEIRIFKFLSKYVKDPISARKFIDILLPFLSKGVQSSDVCRESVQVIQGIIPILGSEITTTILNGISPLFVSGDRDLRTSLCDLLETLAQVDPSVTVVAKLVCDLNATSTVEIGALDYDIIINSYEKISANSANFFYTVPEDQALLILSHCVYDMSSTELILRHSSYGLLLSFLEFAGEVLSHVENDLDTPPPKKIGDHWTEWINLLREMVMKLPNMGNLDSLKVLCDEGVEIDFFNNIIHLQRHRRARALARFRNAIGSNSMPEGIINKVFVPLFFSMLFEVQEGKGEHVRDACIDALASVSGQMKWDSYYSLLLRCFNEINLHPDKQKSLVRLICFILDQFHFSATASSCDNPSDSGTVESSSLITLSKCSGSSVLSEIQICLQKTVLPKIQKLLESDSDRVNVNVNLAALKILKLLPGDIMDSQLPTIVHRVSNFLKNRLESIRDEARSALAACLKELGLEYLQFLVKVLRTTLKRGYEMHVLGYTLNFILSKFLSVPVCGKLDYCLEDLLSIVENDILGEVAEEKDVDKIASKMKETRKRKSFETLQLIAQSITFKTHALKVLSPVASHLQNRMTPKIKAKLESMLNHIAAGIGSNPSVDQTDLFIFLFGLIEDGIKNKDENSTISNTPKNRKKGAGGKNVPSVRVKHVKSLGSHLIIVFALGILHKSVKSLKNAKNDVKVLAMLDPFIPLLGNCLNSKYEDVLSATLRCLTPLVRLPLPSIESQVDTIKGSLFDIAQSTINVDSSLMQSCLRLLTVILGGTNTTLSSEELHLLIQLPLFVELERNPSFVALSLLKAIVSRKLVVPEIYDLVTRVAELMVTSQVEPIRQKCSQILLQFLLDYRLSGKRLQQHLDSLLSNLRYEHPSGRKAALEMLHAIIVKFPKSVVDDQSQTLFIHLVACLANDLDSEVHAMSGAAIKRLIGCVSAHSLHSILESSLSWYMDEKPKLWSAAAQVLGLLVEGQKKGFEKHIRSSVLPRARTILKSAIDDYNDRSQDYSDEATIPFWKEAYYSLIMLEKILHEFHDLCFEEDLEDVWDAICELLLHPHTWLRDISSRLVAFYFSAVTELCKKNRELSLQSYFLTRPSRLFMIAVSTCCQLKTKVSDDAASNLIVQNIVFTVCGVHSLMGQPEHEQPQRFWSTLEQHEQGHFLKALKLIDSGKVQTSFLSLTLEDNGHSKALRNLLISTMLKKMGKIALQMESIQMKIVFNSYGKIFSQFSDEDRQLYAYEILLPLYKVCEGFAGRLVSATSTKVSTVLDKCYAQAFVQVYSEIRKMLKTKRDKRKQEEKIMAVVNPMRNAKRKLRIAAKHRAHKKKKIMTMKYGRWV
uniref:ARM repeat superfamily protein n=1 Tax=Cannabis sativa TaxID=3483 RepID=A0A803Q1W1_CANSA